MRRFCLGKKPPLVDSRTLQFAMYIRKPALPVPPTSLDHGKAVTHCPVYGIDRYGDCTCAGAGHVIQIWRANNGAYPVKLSTDEVVAFYSYFTKAGT